MTPHCQLGVGNTRNLPGMFQECWRHLGGWHVIHPQTPYWGRCPIVTGVLPFQAYVSASEILGPIDELTSLEMTSKQSIKLYNLLKRSLTGLQKLFKSFLCQNYLTMV